MFKNPKVYAIVGLYLYMNIFLSFEIHCLPLLGISIILEWFYAFPLFMLRILHFLLLGKLILFLLFLSTYTYTHTNPHILLGQE